ncbi:alpha/beta hydrolase [Hyalangium versicolor]|uniref:alpha/beta hydrolase n=1 Tax=Hyalangium versicolor TaxID=2861190 RepID=UPI001CCA3739|nr:hypothetical protein [Hyalangium versicolor]
MLPIRVLFIHGLESHPQGSKVRILREQGFDVVAPDMQMAVLQFKRRNSVLRQLLRLPETWLAGVVIGISSVLCIVGSSVLGLTATILLGLIWGAVRGRALVAKAFARSFAACVEVQRAAVQREKPEIIVGSSWGGAIAAELIIRGEWSGPTVLLAPAILKASEWMGRLDSTDKMESIRARSTQVPIVVFHDPSDDTVPHQDSVELARGSRIDFRSVDAGGHRLMGLLNRGELAEAIQGLSSPGDNRHRPDGSSHPATQG